MSCKPECTQFEAEIVSLCKYPDDDNVQVIINASALHWGRGSPYIHSLYRSVVALVTCDLFER